jgi:spore maturation protein CgeB
MVHSSKGYDKPRILMFSQRNIFNGKLFRCPHYEFEDIVRQIDYVDFLAPKQERWFNSGYRIAKRIAYNVPIALNPGIQKTKVQNYYDLLFAVFGYPMDLLCFNTLTNWKDRCRTSICLLDELWVRDLHKFKNYLKILSKFDYVMLYYSQSVKAVSEVIGRKCFFLPPGVDAILFCPYPQKPKRLVDVYSIGRKAEVTHQTLQRMVKEKKIFYLHDSVSGDTAFNTKEHRLLLANTAKRSRYFIVNPGLIDRPEIRGEQSEMGNRYFEGAASGAIMIGEHPQNDEFGKLFDWPDAVLHLPFDSADIDTIINEFDQQHDRQENIRRNGVVQSLLRHDWVYRWETVLKTAGLEPTPAFLERKQQLNNLAISIEKEA